VFSLRDERTAENVSLGMMALVSAAAGLPAAADPATAAFVGTTLDATVIAINANACESTAECVSNVAASSATHAALLGNAQSTRSF
jgi:hypothetical protein